LDYNNLCEIPLRNSQLFPGRVSHIYRTPNGFETRTWSDFMRDIACLSAGLESFGLSKSAHCAFFADNRYEWTMTDYALLALGAVSVPRGSDTSPKEQKFIFLHSDSNYLIMERSRNLREFIAECAPDELNLIKGIFLMDEETSPVTAEFSPLSDKIIYYREIMEKGRAVVSNDPSWYSGRIRSAGKDDLASIIYTSGTSGNPKGVMLTHGNFLHNVRAITPLLWIDIDKGDKTVSILPSWHVYERAFEYCTAAGAVAIFYSSVKNLAEDLVREKPDLVCSVPRVWESIYEKLTAKMEKESPIKRFMFNFFLKVAKSRFTAMNYSRGYVLNFKKSGPFSFAGRALNNAYLFLIHPLYLAAMKVFAPLRALVGGNLRASFSGGGSLPAGVDLLFNSIGIKLVNAFGMTETSPGAITRRLDRNTIGSIGIPLPEVQVKIVKENGWPANTGEKGVLFVKGPNVMLGYYKNPAATAEALSADGWLNTGDLAALSFNGDYVMTGRAKSTIVLLGGENAEPEPIEEKLRESALIDHAVVLGQDKKGLAAIIQVNEEKLKHMAEKFKISLDELVQKGGDVIKNNRILAELNKEVKKLINRDTGFKPSEKITKIILVKKKFSIGDELTQTLKIKRHHVEKKYKDHLK
jgi:long-chain acyl-CoA synthetase